MRTSMRAERTFRAMGTTCSVVVFGSGSAIENAIEGVADLGVGRVRVLEQLWSRFLDTSELSRLNQAAGNGSLPVSEDTVTLVTAMRRGWELTSGAFDPSVLHAIRSQGYDRDFTQVIASDFVTGATVTPTAAPGMASVVVRNNEIELPAGLGLDPGAIGKGLAADIVVDELRSTGVDGVLVDLGGDIAFAGTPGQDKEWIVSIRDERNPKSSKLLGQARWEAGVEHAGIATSTTKTRRWAGSRHHVLDPTTGVSTNETVVQATVSGERAWECEVWATSCVVRPEATIESLPPGFAAVVLGQDRVMRDDFARTWATTEVA
jgi:thiamine biosynthesis lipoprotein